MKRYHPNWRLAVTMLCLCLLTGLWGCTQAGGAAESDVPTGSGEPAHDGCGTWPGGIEPELRVDGTIYRWAGMSKELYLVDGHWFVSGDSSTCLPEGYAEAGTIASVTEEAPTGERQLRAGFAAAGTVYTSETTPAAVYVWMTTDWFEDRYVRFVSAALGDNQLIAYQGRQYRFAVGDSGQSERLKELPEHCDLLGTLSVAGKDSVPIADLETNCMGDTYCSPLDGREVYWDPADPSVLYVYERQYWREGDDPAYRACHLWGE